ncbi:MAG: peptidase U32 [Methanosarcinales archaeon]|nr:peptidase U32 [Methanosarcinales archaeon]
MMRKRPELLAPAGNWESFIAAVENGADAVYLGAKTLGARAYAGNFTLEEIREAIDHAHLRGVRVFVTINTLIKDPEIEKAAKMLCSLSEYGADAVIVQDIGLLSLAKDIVPELPIHASTQMTIHNTEGVRFLEDLGVKRVVLAREMSLDEIRSVKQATNIEIETFVHGALCISYSGQCLLSSMIGGRSGNRGHCAQPCRKMYELEMDGELIDTDGSYLLSPKDLNTMELLPQLIEAGVDSFKIEGRMKRPEYVAGVVSIYRRLIDRYLDDPDSYFVSSEDSLVLEQLFNREFTDVYLKGTSRTGMMSREQPYNRGVVAGTVVGYNSDERRIIVELSNELALGDGIGAEGLEGAGENITRMVLDGEEVDSGTKGDVVEIPFIEKVRSGSLIYRTMDRSLMESLKKTFTSPKPIRKVPVRISSDIIAGSVLQLEMVDADGNVVSLDSDYVVEIAQKKPTTQEQIVQQFSKLGNSVFEPVDVDITVTGDVFIPIRALNDIRNLAVSQLESSRIEKGRRNPNNSCKVTDVTCEEMHPGKPLLVVSVDEPRRLVAAIDGGADVIYAGGEVFRGREILGMKEAFEKCRSEGKMIYVNTPKIVSDEDMGRVQETLELAKELGFDGAVVSNYGTFRLAKESGMNVVADSPMNVFNLQSYASIKQLGAASVVLSPEMSLSQVEDVAQCGHVECIVHGRLEVMESRYCMVGDLFSTGAGCSRKCEEGEFELFDEKEYCFPLLMDKDCRMHILNSKELCMIENIGKLVKAGVAAVRIEARTMDASNVKKVTQRYRAALDGKKKAGKCKDITDGYTSGHYMRGVL